jgi:hypothetical protein
MSETRLPRQVREQSERIRALQEQQRGTDDPNSPPPAAPAGEPAASAAPSETPSPAPAPRSASSDLQPFGDPHLDDDPRAKDPMYWRQRLNILQSFHKRDRQAHDRREAELNKQIEELQEQLRSKPSEPQAQQMDLGTYFTPEQIERFGQEQCEAMASAAEASARKTVATMIDAEVKPIREREKANTQRQAEDRLREFEEGLAALVPNFREVDETPEWREQWLQQADPHTGDLRQEILNKLCRAYDVARVAKMFQAFAAERAAGAPPAPPVVPPRAAGQGNAPPPPPPIGGYPSSAEIKDYYKRSALGKVKDAERVAFEARLSTRAAA